jgi:N-methylhydantoinase A/oxoprolinase/acetone carboxylase beta subunit
VKSSDSVHVIACGVLALDIQAIAGRLGIDVTVDFLPGGLHEEPLELKRRLQRQIDAVSANTRADRIVLGYGACGMGTVGISARQVPLAIPRVHDCIALFLGSDAAYRREFNRYPGTYYISAGWVNEKAQPQSIGEGPIRCGPDCYTFEQLTAKYGPENATAIRDFLNSWQRNYQRAAVIDTGVEGRERYAAMARDMAEQFGWKYEEIAGSHDLLTKLLTAHHSTDEILLVPPHHTTAYDAVGRTLRAVPVWESDTAASHRDYRLVYEAPGGVDVPAGAPVRLGLGIDAGGTYTDVAIYDFHDQTVLAKAKSLTTRWDFTVGIGKALDQLDASRLRQVDLVSISTTLATNAIVENRGQKVGLLIFPPYGLFDPADITYRPLDVLEGRLEVDGRELAPINPAEVRRVARRMLETERVGAFAISGYASDVNPSHELQVKTILRELTDVSVTCAHEVSDKPDYRVRSVTAALNASIIPCLESFLDAADAALGQRGIDCARMVVKSDGSLMNLSVARRRPIETVLSGPAASVAGASYLARLPDAMVVDMGGTTTDTAIIRRGQVRVSRVGASVGGWRTHVGALDLRTVGLGGDSLIARTPQRELQIGPRRVAPVAWTFSSDRNPAASLDWLTVHIDRFRTSTFGMELVARTQGEFVDELQDSERRILDLLDGGPRCLDEMAQLLGVHHWQFLPLERLEQRHLVERSGLTPTDLLHASGQLDLWNTDAARRYCELFRRLLGVSSDQLANIVHDRIVRQLALELVKKQLADQTGAEAEEPVDAAALLENWLSGGNDDYQVRLALRYPIIGIGAPVHFFLPDAARLLETQVVIPPHADVANAIGAITSQVLVQMKLEVSPREDGRYSIAGLPDAPSFGDFREALDFALREVTEVVRRQAREAGTSEMRVTIDVHDHVAPAADGSIIFLGRDLTARLSGPPNLCSPC